MLLKIFFQCIWHKMAKCFHVSFLYINQFQLFGLKIFFVRFLNYCPAEKDWVYL